jgi:hypothetical protein
MYPTGKCLQGISTITKGIGYRVAHLDQTAKELKIAHGLSGNPMPKSTMPKTNIVNTVNNPTTPIATSLKSMQGAGDVISNLRSKSLLQNDTPILKTAETSASSSNFAQKVSQTVQVAKQFIAQPQPGYLDLQKSSAISISNAENMLRSCLAKEF